MIREEASAYNRRAPKRATNVTVNSDLLRQARELGINLSAALERALVELIRQRRRQEWLAENKTAIDRYNAHVAKSGVYSDGLRSF